MPPSREGSPGAGRVHFQRRPGSPDDPSGHHLRHDPRHPAAGPAAPEDAKGAYAQFHLLVDDMSHYGRIEVHPTGEFNPEAGGYSYRQGRFLVSPLEELHRRAGRKISTSEAIYQSHMMVEMAFDLNLYLRGNGGLLDLFLEALDDTARKGLNGFSLTMGRLLGIERNTVAEAVVRGRDKYDRPRMEGFLSREGRTDGFINKFRLDREDRIPGRESGR